jgi:hypothetical protein
VTQRRIPLFMFVFHVFAQVPMLIAAPIVLKRSPPPLGSVFQVTHFVAIFGSVLTAAALAFWSAEYIAANILPPILKKARERGRPIDAALSDAAAMPSRESLASALPPAAASLKRVLSVAFSPNLAISGGRRRRIPSLTDRRRRLGTYPYISVGRSWSRWHCRQLPRASWSHAGAERLCARRCALVASCFAAGGGATLLWRDPGWCGLRKIGLLTGTTGHSNNLDNMTLDRVAGSSMRLHSVVLRQIRRSCRVLCRL